MTAPVIDRPEPMFGKCRLVRGGIFVPGRIWLDDSIPDRPAVLLAEINGREVDVHDAWVRLCGNPISADEFAHLMRVKDHVEKYEPDAPEAQPTKRISLSQQAAIEPRR